MLVAATMGGMKKHHEIPEISPIIERWHPNVSLAEKKELTRDLRLFVAALSALDRALVTEGGSADSAESDSHAILDSDKPKSA